MFERTQDSRLVPPQESYFSSAFAQRVTEFGIICQRAHGGRKCSRIPRRNDETCAGDFGGESGSWFSHDNNRLAGSENAAKL